MSKKLYVGNLSYDTTSDDLRDAFSQFGSVTSAEVMMDRDTGRSRGFGFVEMADGAAEAIKGLDLTELQGRKITVSEARPREDRRGGGGGGGRGGSRGGGRRY
jgi:RNA recognition motif-containing protein